MLQNGGGGMLSFTPMKRGGGAQKELAILKGGRKKFPLLKRGSAKRFSLSRGGVQKVPDP